MSDGIRVSGKYAIYQGEEYPARTVGAEAILYYRTTPLPPGFSPSRLERYKGELRIERQSLDRLYIVQTTCIWRNARFTLVVLNPGGIACIYYLDRGNPDLIASYEGFEYLERYVLCGFAPLSELTDINESETEIPLEATAEEIRHIPKRPELASIEGEVEK